MCVCVCVCEHMFVSTVGVQHVLFLFVALADKRKGILTRDLGLFQFSGQRVHIDVFLQRGAAIKGKRNV